MICQKFADHRAGYSFLKSIKDDNYALAVKFPMCLDMVRSRIRDGRITNIPELHRDLLLMVSNAIMFNPENSDISEMASEMMQSIDFELHSFLVHHKLST